MPSREQEAMMDSVERDRLSEVMGGMAAGDMAMLVAFVTEFGTPLRSLVRRTVFAFGRRDVLDDPGEVTSLVTTAALEIFDRADGWDDSGAPPWVWAERAIRSAVARQVGHAIADVTIEEWSQVREGPVQQTLRGLDGDARQVLTRLSVYEPRAQLWWDAVGGLTNDRNRNVYFEFVVQQALGDRAPAQTVAPLFDLRPDNVRQIVRRVRLRLAERIRTDARLEPLRDLRWFAA
jgi:hypothetical protein